MGANQKRGMEKNKNLFYLLANSRKVKEKKKKGKKNIYTNKKVFKIQNKNFFSSFPTHCIFYRKLNSI